MDSRNHIIFLALFLNFICSCHRKATKEVLSPLMEYSYHIQYKGDTIFVHYQKEDGSSKGFVPAIMVKRGGEYYSDVEEDGILHRRLELTLKDTCFYEKYYKNDYFVRFEKDSVDSLYRRSDYHVINQHEKKLLNVCCYDENFHIIRIIKPQVVIYQQTVDKDHFDYMDLHGIGKDESDRCEF